MKVTYSPTGINNFHNSPDLNLVITGVTTQGHSDEVYRISKGQAQRIERHFCGVTDCRCPQGAVEQLNEAATEFGIRVTFCRHEEP